MYDGFLHTYPGLPSGVLECPRLVLGYGMGGGFGDVLGLSLAILDNPRFLVCMLVSFHVDYAEEGAREGQGRLPLSPV